MKFTQLIIKILNTYLKEWPVEQLIFIGNKMRTCITQINYLFKINTKRVILIRKDARKTVIQRERAARIVFVVNGLFAVSPDDVSLKHQLPGITQEECTALSVIANAGAVIQLDCKKERFLRFAQKTLIGVALI